MMSLDIQSWWELPSVAHFCSLFRAAFDLLHFDIEELEEAILCDDSNAGTVAGNNGLVVELVVRLLQGCLPHTPITAHNVDHHLVNIFKEKCQADPSRENLFISGSTLNKLGLRHKVQLLHALCDFRLEADDVLDLLKNLESDSLRVEPLGYDACGSTYWYFYGTRLYREDHSLYHPHRRRPKEKDKLQQHHDRKKRKKKKKGGGKDDSCDDDDEEPEPVWQVQCYTESDWNKLAERFEGCESRLERSLLQTLRDDFLPEIPRLFQEKEKLQHKKMMEQAPRRTSGRVQKMKEKKDVVQRKGTPTETDAKDKPDDDSLSERLGLLASLSGATPLKIKSETPDYDEDEMQEYTPRGDEGDYLAVPPPSSATPLSPPTSSSPPPPPPISQHPPPLSSTLRLSSPSPPNVTPASSNTGGAVVDEYDIDLELDRVQNSKQSYSNSRSYRKTTDLSYRRLSSGSGASSSATTPQALTSGASSSPPPPPPVPPSECHSTPDDTLEQQHSPPHHNNNSNNNNNNDAATKAADVEPPVVVNSSNSSNNFSRNKNSSRISSSNSSSNKSKSNEDILVNSIDTRRASDAKAEEHEGKKRKKRHSSTTQNKSKKKKASTGSRSKRSAAHEDSNEELLDEEEEEEEYYRPRPGRRRSSLKEQELALAASLAEEELMQRSPPEDDLPSPPLTTTPSKKNTNKEEHEEEGEEDLPAVVIMPDKTKPTPATPPVASVVPPKRRGRPPKVVTEAKVNGVIEEFERKDFEAEASERVREITESVEDDEEVANDNQKLPKDEDVEESSPFLSPLSCSSSISKASKKQIFKNKHSPSRPSLLTKPGRKSSKSNGTGAGNKSCAGRKRKTQKRRKSKDSDDEDDDDRMDGIISCSDSSKPQVYSGRKTNNSLSSLAFSLSPATAAVVPEPTEPPPTINTQPTKKKVKSAHVVLQTDEDLRTGMYKVLEHLRNHDDAWAFLDPVDESIAPNYYAVIRRPMHITKLEDRLDRGYYASLAMFDADFKLMMDNCKLYNGPDSEYTHMAYTLEKVFAKLRAKYLETDLSSDEEMYIDMSYQQNLTTKKRRRSSNSDEKENNKEFKGQSKRGRKKKVGRKPKDPSKSDKIEKLMGRKSSSTPGIKMKEPIAKAVAKSKLKKNSKKSPLKEFDLRDEEFQDFQDKLYEDSLSTLAETGGCKEDEVSGDADVTPPQELPTGDQPSVEEDEEDDDDDYDDHPLLVREDPYPEDDDEDLNTSAELQVSPSSRKGQFKKVEPIMTSPNKSLVPKRKPGRPRKDSKLKAAVITQVYNTNREVNHNNSAESKRSANIPAVKYTDDSKHDDGHITPSVSFADDKDGLTKDRQEDNDDEDDELEDDYEEPGDHRLSWQDTNDNNGLIVPPPAADVPDDDDEDDIEPDVCIYYRNDNYQSSEEENEARAKKEYINKRHNELFGEIDDLEDEENNAGGPCETEGQQLHHHSGHHHNEDEHYIHKKHGSSKKKERKRHKHGEKHHHHSSSHHHHHHKSKSKDGLLNNTSGGAMSKHHHKKKEKKDKSGGRKVLKVEEVYDCSEEDPTTIGGGGRRMDAGGEEVEERSKGMLEEDEEEEQQLLEGVEDEGEHDTSYERLEDDDLGRLSIDVGGGTSSNETSSTSPSKKKKSKHKSKHHSKHGRHKEKEGKSKNKEGKYKNKEGKNKETKGKDGKNKSKDGKKKNNKKKKIPEKNMAAISALSAATEQTLKDITTMLEAPGVARLSQDEELSQQCSPFNGIEEGGALLPPGGIEDPGLPAQSSELLPSALSIEEEYRLKLQQDQQQHKKKKRKREDNNTDEQQTTITGAPENNNKKKKIKVDEAGGEETSTKKKKVKTKGGEGKVKVKSDKTKVKSDTEAENEKVKPVVDKKCDSDKEDNMKDLFKDIKEGRIKPGAIIKSKDIAKKEGVVKKEPKPPPEAKPKTKPNHPFGKINKQENSKLTTLIAKAKESRVGLVPNSEVGDSPKLSLGSIIVGGDIGTGIKSTHETDDDEKWEPREKWESSPWEGVGAGGCSSSFDRQSEREENSTPVREEEIVKSERAEDLDDVIVCNEKPAPGSERVSERGSSVRSEERVTIIDEIVPPTPRAPEIKQERATPNLSAWFKAFGAPKTSSASAQNLTNNKKNDSENCEDDDEGSDIAEVGGPGVDYPHSIGGSGSDYSRPHSQQGRLSVADKGSTHGSNQHSPSSSVTNINNSSIVGDDLCRRDEAVASASPLQEDQINTGGSSDCRTPGSVGGGVGGGVGSDVVEDVVEVVADDSNDDSAHSPENMGQPMLPSSPKSMGSPQPPLSPQPPMSPEKPPETPWYQKLDEKMEDEPIWRKNKIEEEEDPYKFEEEELDRAREEAKKLEVERQRKASVSSSGVSERSPLPSLENSPAAFSSEGERSPAINSPVTPGFGGKQFSPVPDKSPNIPSYSPRYENSICKGYNSFDSDKPKYQANGTLKVGFYKESNDKSNQDKQDGKSSEHKPTESPLYSPTVPYVSYYSKPDSVHKQKSPGRYSNFYPPSIDAGVDKPKTPGYYPSSAPPTPSDKPSPNTHHHSEPDKSKAPPPPPPFNYYNYDPNKPLTDQYKNTGSTQSTPSHNHHPVSSRSTPNHSEPPPHSSMSHILSAAQQQPSQPPPPSHNSLPPSSRHPKAPAPPPYYDTSPAGPSPSSTSASLTLSSPNQLPGHHQHQPPMHDKPLDLPPPKKRPGLDRVMEDSVSSRMRGSALDVSLFQQHQPPPPPTPHDLPANLANLTQIVSRYPEPNAGSGLNLQDKESSMGGPTLNLHHHERTAMSCPPPPHSGPEKSLHSPVYDSGGHPSDGVTPLGMVDIHQTGGIPSRRSQIDLGKGRDLDLQMPERPASLAYHNPINSSLMPPSQAPHNSVSKHQSQLHSSYSQQPQPPPAAHQKALDAAERPNSRSVPPPPNADTKSHYLPPKTMWTSSTLASSLPVSLSSTLASTFNSAAMAQFALAGQKSFSSLPPERLAQLGMDRAALASLAASRSAAANFPHDLLSGRGQPPPPQGQLPPPSGVGGPQSGGSAGSGPGGPGSSSSSHLNNGGSVGGGSGPGGSGGPGGSASVVGRSSINNAGGAGSSNMDLSLARSYASLMTGGQSSPLFGRGEGALTPGGSLPRSSLPGSTSPFLPQSSPGLSSSLSMPGAPRTPTPAHQQPHQALSLSQSNFSGSLGRDPISQSHPSLQIPSLNSLVSSQSQISHLNAAAGLASYHTRDSLALMGQSGRAAGALASGLVDPAASHQLYEQYLQRQQQELLLRSAGHQQLAAQHTIMMQQGFMSAAGYPSGYPASLGLRSGSFQGMNRPWL